MNIKELWMAVEKTKMVDPWDFPAWLDLYWPKLGTTPRRALEDIELKSKMFKLLSEYR